MAASQVVLYFENQEDAVLFALAASSAMSAAAEAASDAGLKMANEVSKASRITTEGILNGNEEVEASQLRVA